MASAHAIYTRYSDEVARNATITIETGVDLGDPDYAPASLVDDNPAQFAKIGSTTGAWEFDFGSPQLLALIALIQHDFDAGADVKIQGSAAPNWAGSPATAPEFSAAMVIPTWFAPGTIRAWPVNPWLDISALTTTAYRYWRLIVTANSQNLELGQVIMSASIRRLDPDLQWEPIDTPMKRLIRNTTEFGISTKYTRGTTQRRREGGHRIDDAFNDLLIQHWYDVDGSAQPWLLIPDGTINDAMMVEFVEITRPVTHFSPDVRDNRFVVQELGRGLRPGV